MAFKNKIYLVILGLVGQLFFLGHIAPEHLEASDNALEQETLLLASLPKDDRLILISQDTQTIVYKLDGSESVNSPVEEQSLVGR